METRSGKKPSSSTDEPVTTEEFESYRATLARRADRLREEQARFLEDVSMAEEGMHSKERSQDIEAYGLDGSGTSEDADPDSADRSSCVDQGEVVDPREGGQDKAEDHLIGAQPSPVIGVMHGIVQLGLGSPTGLKSPVVESHPDVYMVMEDEEGLAYREGQPQDEVEDPLVPALSTPKGSKRSLETLATQAGGDSAKRRHRDEKARTPEGRRHRVVLDKSAPKLIQELEGPVQALGYVKEGRGRGLPAPLEYSEPQGQPMRAIRVSGIDPRGTAAGTTAPAMHNGGGAEGPEECPGVGTGYQDNGEHCGLPPRRPRMAAPVAQASRGRVEAPCHRYPGVSRSDDAAQEGSRERNHDYGHLESVGGGHPARVPMGTLMGMRPGSLVRYSSTSGSGGAAASGAASHSVSGEGYPPVGQGEDRRYSEEELQRLLQGQAQALNSSAERMMGAVTRVISENHMEKAAGDAVGSQLLEKLGHGLGTRRKDMNVETFKCDSEDWTDYLAKFEVVAEGNRWKEADKLRQLIGHLQGTALAIYADNRPTTFAALVGLLNARYMPDGIEETYKLKFRARQIQPGEEPEVYVHELRRLARRAYPERDAGLLNGMVLDQFKEGLKDAGLRKHVALGGYRTVSAAIMAASIYLRFTEVEGSTVVKPGRRGTDGARVAVASASTVDSQEQKRYEVLERKVDSLSRPLELACAALSGWQKATGPGQGNGGQNEGTRGRARRPVTCWCCHEKGHLYRACPRNVDRQYRPTAEELQREEAARERRERLASGSKPVTETAPRPLNC